MNVFSFRNDDDIEMHNFVNFVFAKLNISEHQSRCIYIKYVFEIDVVSFDD